jgi:hypothetical protein
VTPLALRSDARRRGIDLRVENGRLKYRCARDALDPVFLANLKANRDAIMAELGAASPRTFRGAAPVGQFESSPPPETAADHRPSELLSAWRLRGLAVRLGSNGFDLRLTPRILKWCQSDFEVLVERQDEIREVLGARLPESPRGSA